MSQSTSNETENEPKEDSEQNWAPRRRMNRERTVRGTRIPIAESESSQAESNEPATESTSKYLGFKLKCISPQLIFKFNHSYSISLKVMKPLR